jgi:sortase A
MKALRTILVWVMVGAGSAAIAFPALSYGQASLRQQRLSQEVRTLLGPDLLAAAPAAPAQSPSSPAGAHSNESPQGDSTTAAPQVARRIAAFRPVEGQALGLVQIPSVGIDAAFLEGVTDETLMAGPGHLPGTALPGTHDVSVIAAHRDAHFRDLKDVEVGDSVVLRLPSGPVEYRVTRLAIADPDDAWVTVLRGRPMLRLVTCWPPNFLGPAPQRLVVTAVPVSEPAHAAPAESATPKPRSAGADSNAGTSAATLEPATAAPRAITPAAPLEQPQTAIALAATPDGVFPAGSLPPVGTAGGTIAALAAFGAYRSSRRLAWWFLPWVGGLGLAVLSLLAAWAGPQLVSV